jgi:hypothetical protein
MLPMSASHNSTHSDMKMHRKQTPAAAHAVPRAPQAIEFIMKIPLPSMAPQPDKYLP